jgi:hypothetical protein
MTQLLTRTRKTLLVLSLACASTNAQTTTGGRPWWITFSGGLATPGESLTMVAGAVYGKQFESSIVSARILGATNDNPTVRQLDPSAVTYRLTDYGILYGPAYVHAHGYVSAGVGLGLARTSREQGLTADGRSSISIPVEVQAFWQLSDFFGVGAYAFGSVNGARSFSGILLGIQLGVFAQSK